MVKELKFEKPAPRSPRSMESFDAITKPTKRKGVSVIDFNIGEKKIIPPHEDSRIDTYGPGYEPFQEMIDIIEPRLELEYGKANQEARDTSDKHLFLKISGWSDEKILVEFKKLENLKKQKRIVNRYEAAVAARSLFFRELIKQAIKRGLSPESQ